MIGRLNHIAIVVPDLEVAADTYKRILGAKISEIDTLMDHGVKLVFVELPNTKIELLHPIDETSPIFSFLKKNPAGGMHHICYEVDDVVKSRDLLRQSGARILGDGEPKVGAHGKLVIFMHPGDFSGTLIELEQA
jgi:methylmalonyl-CoA/ethylmalonyl-CoA epimerase